MWRDDAYLLDILNAARKVSQFITGATEEEFERNELLQSATMRQLGIIGEAARKVSQETRNAHSEIPWSEMIGMRNRLIHEYSRINLKRVWDTIQNDIPRLMTLIEPLVPPPEEE
ncbi:MAG: DUF86 domain-containing protein [Deltaproteobacteria bacterium]|nr:DUF86 domain-containing protein [Deltaproteobacteria bacterium]